MKSVSQVSELAQRSVFAGNKLLVQLNFLVIEINLKIWRHKTNDTSLLVQRRPLHH